MSSQALEYSFIKSCFGGSVTYFIIYDEDINPGSDSGGDCYDADGNYICAAPITTTTAPAVPLAAPASLTLAGLSSALITPVMVAAAVLAQAVGLFVV